MLRCCPIKTSNPFLPINKMTVGRKSTEIKIGIYTHTKKEREREREQNKRSKKRNDIFKESRHT